MIIGNWDVHYQKPGHSPFNDNLVITRGSKYLSAIYETVGGRTKFFRFIVVERAQAINLSLQEIHVGFCGQPY
jgi:hypothetical protein